MGEQVVVGVDGGGTSTTALVAELNGTVLSIATGGGANPTHNRLRDAHDAVQSTIREALRDAQRDVSSVAALTAGFAGLDSPSDRQWADAFATLSSLSCEPVVVNDAVVAHAGALGGDPGVVAVCGTGSIAFGIDADGRQIRNYDLDHYAEAAARHLGRRLLHRLVAGEGGPADESFVATVLDRWDVESRDELREAAIDGDLLATDESDNALDRVASLVTDAATADVPLAEAVCDAAIREVVTGITAVAGFLDETPTRVALEGGVLRSESMTKRVAGGLAAADGRFEGVEPALPPAAGAALLGLERLDEDDPTTVGRLADERPVTEA